MEATSQSRSSSRHATTINLILGRQCSCARQIYYSNGLSNGCCVDPALYWIRLGKFSRGLVSQLFSVRPPDPVAGAAEKRWRRKRSVSTNLPLKLSRGGRPVAVQEDGSIVAPFVVRRGRSVVLPGSDTVTAPMQSTTRLLGTSTHRETTPVSALASATARHYCRGLARVELWRRPPSFRNQVAICRIAPGDGGCARRPCMKGNARDIWTVHACGGSDPELMKLLSAKHPSTWVTHVRPRRFSSRICGTSCPRSKVFLRGMREDKFQTRWSVANKQSISALLAWKQRGSPPSSAHG
jgi:hypothetical protein